MRSPGALDAVAGRDPDALAGVEADAPVGDDFAQEQAEQAHDVFDGAFGDALSEVFDEDLPGLPGDLVQGCVAEAGQDVIAKIAVVGDPLGGSGLVSLAPDRHPFGEGDPPAFGSR